MTEHQKRFIGYDYKEIAAEPGRISFLIDGYESFGWKVDENMACVNVPASGIRTPANIHQKNTLRLKRDRKIINKAELTRLQGHFEACVSEIDALEKTKTTTPAIAAITAGIIGTAFIAGSVFAVTAQTPLIILSIILAIPGFAGWGAPYFIYKKMACRQTKKISPLIEKKYDEIYEICEKGANLLH